MLSLHMVGVRSSRHRLEALSYSTADGEIEGPGYEAATTCGKHVKLGE